MYMCVYVYMYESMQSYIQPAQHGTNDCSQLPYGSSRIHARAFGGDLQVMSMQGHGTDVYIYLWKLGDREVAVP